MLNEFYEVLMPKKMLYGRDSFSQVGIQAAELGKKALIISDPVMEKVGNVSLCESYLQERGVAAARYTGIDAEPTDLHVQAALDVCVQEKCELIVAVGGGSCIDTAKAVAVMATNEGYIGDYMGSQKAFAAPPLPLVACPTTAGTGSEVTKVTVIINTQTQVKMMISKPELLPAVAIVDPVLTLSCPPAVTAATGVDALCHAVEAYLSRKSQPVTDTLALTAIAWIIGNLLQCYRDGEDLDAREKVALGAMLAGAAFSNASVTLVHGMSRPIGALFHVPHGISNAMLLPVVLDYTKDSAVDKLANIGCHLHPEWKHVSKQQAAEQTIAKIKELCALLHIPNMKSWGIDQEAFERSLSKMATDALASGSPGNNPIVPTHQEIMHLYQVSYDYELTSPRFA
ncbi:iron-containing alcohol dehydrogenase [Brevibacillus choshinensis]|uniref:Iron-containing alcohol dehydrogenase n=1 Tax=Brevibacillus choshinensis TaxID=54911 RepID=A0ABX7FHQ5_BRECH|nr:iron-containing alcohol dehydrogenase [Brevibacillus choshinensis]QRG65318.1 iron-containing alcohol dehydrogenase [Brevibacillus choshinensis]